MAAPMEAGAPEAAGAAALAELPALGEVVDEVAEHGWLLCLACDIDFIAKEQHWTAGYHAEEDAYSLWGPEPPDYFGQNCEGATSTQF